jgi:hypothetical protein
VEQVIGVYQDIADKPPVTGEDTLIDKEPPPDENQGTEE